MRIVNTAASTKSAPQAPTIGTATNVGSGRAYNNGAATVTFSAPAFDGKLPITSYTATSSPGGFTASGAGSPLTVTGLASGTNYTFSVTATNGVGTGAASVASNSITATTVPQAPTIGTATASSGSASVTFTANATGGSAITGYTVTSSPGGLTGTGASSPITVSGLTNGTAYTFTVTATNANGTSTASAASNSVTPQAYWISFQQNSNINNTPNANYYGVASSILVDSSGNTYSVQGNQGTPNGLIKTDSSGTILWQKNITQNVYFQGQLKFDSSGNIIQTFCYTDGNYYVGVVKYDTSGNVLASQTFKQGTFVFNEVSGLATDSSGNIYISMYCDEGNTLYYRNVIKMNSNLAITWQRRISPATDPNSQRYANGLTVDSSGNVYWWTSQSYDYVLIKWNSSGTLQWQKKWAANNPSAATDRPYGIALDTAGNLVCVGSSQYGGSTSATIFKIDNTGTALFTREASSSQIGENYAVTVDSSNNYWVSGYYQGWEAHWSKYDSSGNLQLLRQLGRQLTDAGQNLGYGITLNSGATTVYGAMQARFQGATQGNKTLPLIYKVPSDGSKTGTYTVGGYGNFIYNTGTATVASNTFTASNATFTEAAGNVSTGVTALTFATPSWTMTPTNI